MKKFLQSIFGGSGQTTTLTPNILHTERSQTMSMKCEKCDHPYPARFDVPVSRIVSHDPLYPDRVTTKPKPWEESPGGPKTCPKCGAANTFDVPPPAA